MDDSLIVWRETLRVRSQDMDDLWRLRLAALCNFLQESAVAHAQALGMGRDALLTGNLTWVLSRFHVRVTDYPRWGQDLTVETWPSAVSGQFALRELRIVDAGPGSWPWPPVPGRPDRDIIPSDFRQRVNHG